ncbi:MAG: hypothetical protein F6K42_07715 [Leptolyngbya sp. SIO1D8]|nr:hypothetical protein [Leptolyngbya sp. SIO1D8]
MIELFDREEIQENRIALSNQLNQTFLKYWSYLGSVNHNPDISKPFFHMKSGKFWHLMMNPGFESVLAAKVKLKTFAEVKRAVAYAYLDEDLFDFLIDASIRESLLATLVGRWFPGRLAEVNRILQLDEFQEPPGYFLEAYAMYMERLNEA